MPRKPSTARAAAGIERILKQLAQARARVAELEAQVAQMQASLSNALPKATPSPAHAMQPELRALMSRAQLEDPAQPPVDLAPQDNMGEGRWLP